MASSLVTIKRLFWATLFAIVFTGVPILAERSPSESTFAKIGILPGMPGTFIALIAAMGRLHDIDFRIADIANAIFYFAFAYIALLIWERRRAKSNGSPPDSD
jgi:hypothetical protein